jgi:hypothetical protein
LRARHAVNKSGLSIALIGGLPLVKYFSGDAKIATGMRDVAKVFGVIEKAKLSSNVVLSLSHSGPPGQKVSRMEISCQPRFRFSKRVWTFRVR